MDFLNVLNVFTVMTVLIVETVETVQLYTGSSRKNDKSKVVFTGTNFHKRLVFSAVLGPELAANLSSTASRSTTITQWHP